ncbi:prephenate dehydrogenase/arogenate dehydrogenase family protein, partial [Patescibacteria group bacterium]|nr:prephenate dehydrogenase/arogenate dehydrogenase family protein [Patescibacteria group bacterium]
ARGVSSQNFVLTPTSDDERVLAQNVKEHLEAKGARVTLMTPREHDEMMAVVLGLALGKALACRTADTWSAVPSRPDRVYHLAG